MKSFLPFSFLIFLIPYAALAQTVTISDEVSIRDHKAYDIFGKMGDHYLFCHKKTNKVEILAFNMQMQKSWNKELKFDHETFKVLRTISDSNSFSIIYHYRKKHENFLRIQKYDAAANMIDSATIVQYSSKFEESPSLLMTRSEESPNKLLKFTKFSNRLTYSEDKTKLLIYSFKSKNDIEAISYDLNQKKILWQASFEIENNQPSRYDFRFILNNKGVMYLAMRKDNIKSKIENHHYLIYRCGAENDDIEVLKLPMESKLTYSFSFRYDNRNQTLVAGGLYAIENKKQPEGYFSIKIPDENFGKYRLIYNKFDNHLVPNLGDKSIKKFEDLKNVYIQDLIVKKDGGMLLMFERIKRYKRRMPKAGRDDRLRGYITDYDYDNIFIAAIHPDGTPDWNQVLYKKQHSRNDKAFFSSYFLLKRDSELSLIFNDQIKSKTNVSEYVLGNNGEYDRNSVMSTKNLDIKLRFKETVQVAPNELIVPSERKNQLKLVRVKF